MAFKRKDSVTQEGGFRRFNAINNMVTADYWQFKYITQDLNGNDQTITGGEVDTDKRHYPQPIGDVLGTIFFDASSTLIYMSTSIADVIIDTTPPVFVGEDIQYTTFQQDHVCKLTIESDTLIDVCQLVIKNGNRVLYQCLRNGEQIKSENISNISYCLKVESKTQISFTTDKVMTIKIMIGPNSANDLKIDGTSVSATDHIITKELSAGSHVISRGNGEGHIFYIGLSE